MLQASTDDGDTMTEFEILATAIELIVAGHETTVNTATKTTHGLLDQGMYADLAKTPEKINGNGMEELLRWASPLPAPAQPLGDRADDSRRSRSQGR